MAINLVDLKDTIFKDKELDENIKQDVAILCEMLMEEYDDVTIPEILCNIRFIQARYGKTKEKVIDVLKREGYKKPLLSSEDDYYGYVSIPSSDMSTCERIIVIPANYSSGSYDSMGKLYSSLNRAVRSFEREYTKSGNDTIVRRGVAEYKFSEDGKLLSTSNEDLERAILDYMEVESMRNNIYDDYDNSMYNPKFVVAGYLMEEYNLRQAFVRACRDGDLSFVRVALYNNSLTSEELDRMLNIEERKEELEIGTKKGLH